MANRFLDTGFYKSPFVRSLKAPLKALYTFIICDCNGSGIWAGDFEVASLYVGHHITKEDFVSAFIDDQAAPKAIDLKDGKFFIPDFVEHQYPKGLQANNPAHINFILELKKYHLLDEALKPLSVGVKRPSKGSKVMVKEKVTVKAEVKEKVTRDEKIIIPFASEKFLEAWDALLTQKKWAKKSALALQCSLKKLSKYPEPVAIQMIENTIEGDWQGLFEIKDYGKQNRTSDKSNVAALGAAARNRLLELENGDHAAGG